MKPVIIDKIASVTRNCDVARRAHLATTLTPTSGDVVAVRILSGKSRYDKLELVSGRMCHLKPGDVVAGALGHRNALLGYAGRVPETLEVGDTVHLLNLGGVIGVCDGANPEVGAPFECEVLGQVLSFPYVGERVGVPANIQQGARPLIERIPSSDVPVIVVAGTCMNAGKTAACVAIIQALTRRGLRVHAAKATGVSLFRDVLQMEDAGADRTLAFTDFGVVTTSPEVAATVARSQVADLAEGSPDVIVMELGDGLMGRYGVDAILADEVLRPRLRAVVLAASDPVGAWGGVRQLTESFGLPTAVVTGPATDNEVGTTTIQDACGVDAINARQEPGRLVERLLTVISSDPGSSRGGRVHVA